MTEGNSTENVELQELHRHKSDTEPELNNLAQGQLNEHVRTDIAPKSKQLQDLTRLIQA